jgi:hypothetical protein
LLSASAILFASSFKAPPQRHHNRISLRQLVRRRRMQTPGSFPMFLQRFGKMDSTHHFLFQQRLGKVHSSLHFRQPLFGRPVPLTRRLRLRFR